MGNEDRRADFTILKAEISDYFRVTDDPRVGKLIRGGEEIPFGRKPLEKQCIFASSNTCLRSLLLRPLFVGTTESGGKRVLDTQSSRLVRGPTSIKLLPSGPSLAQWFSLDLTR